MRHSSQLETTNGYNLFVHVLIFLDGSAPGFPSELHLRLAMIPYNTDAPLYHPPIATVGLIALNTLLFFAVPTSMIELQPAPQEAVGAAWGEEDPPEPRDGHNDTWNADDFRIVDENQQPAAEEAQPDAATGTAESKKTWKLPHVTLALEYGAGLKPWQWLTSLFVHHDFLHLLFNMIALWAFGLVVEGKVGAVVFAALYMGIGIVQSGLEQTLMLFSQAGGSLGASAAIFGMLGIALVWAPRNDFDVFWTFGFHAGSIEVPILMYAFLQLILEGVSISLGRFGMSSGVLHLMGMGLGIGVGWVWLRRQWVDCEGWDLINVWQGKEASIEPDHQLDAQARELVRASTPGRRTTSGTATAPRSLPPAPQASPQATSRRRKKAPQAGSPAHANSTAVQALRDVEQLIAEGNVTTALKLLAKLKVGDRAPQLSQTALQGLVKALLTAQHFTAAIPFMREYIARFDEQRIPMQLNLAKLLLHLQQPRKAVEVLRTMQQAPMDSRVRTAWQELASHAQHQIDEGIIEVSE